MVKCKRKGLAFLVQKGSNKWMAAPKNEATSVNADTVAVIGVDAVDGADAEAEAVLLEK